MKIAVELTLGANFVRTGYHRRAQGGCCVLRGHSCGSGAVHGRDRGYNYRATEARSNHQRHRARVSGNTRICCGFIKCDDFGRLQATISELKAKELELQQRVDSSETTINEISRRLNETKEMLNNYVVALETVDKNCLAWQKRGTEKEQETKKWRQLAEEVKAKADAWDAHIDQINDNLMRQATGDLMTTPLQKMSNMAKLAGLTVFPADTYYDIKRNLLRVVHPDKRRCAFDKCALFDRICVVVSEMPSRV